MRQAKLCATHDAGNLDSAQRPRTMVRRSKISCAARGQRGRAFLHFENAPRRFSLVGCADLGVLSARLPRTVQSLPEIAGYPRQRRLVNGRRQLPARLAAVEFDLDQAAGSAVAACLSASDRGGSWPISA